MAPGEHENGKMKTTMQVIATTPAVRKQHAKHINPFTREGETTPPISYNRKIKQIQPKPNQC